MKKQTRLLDNSLLLVWVGIIVVSFVISFQMTSIGVDATYFLGNSRMIIDGLIPLKDFPIAYPPLSFYIMSGAMTVLGDEVVTIKFIMNTLLLFDSILLYLICIRNSIPQKLSFIGMILFLCLCLLFEGWLYVLEPFVLLFGLASILLVFYDKIISLFFSGLFCFCAFACKQYGIGFIFLVILGCFLTRGDLKKKIQGILYVIGGFILGLVVFFASYYFVGLTPSMVLEQLAGEGYEFKGLGSIMMFAFKLLIFFPAIIAVLVYLAFRNKLISNNPLLLISICGFGGFFLQGLVREYDHYYQLMAPFIVFMTLICVNDVINSCQKRWQVLVIIAIVALSPFAGLAHLNKINLSSNDFEIVNQYAKNVEAIVPRGSKNVYSIRKMIMVSYINEYTPPMIKQYGLLGGVAYSKSDKLKELSVSDYCILQDKAWENQWDCPPELLDYLGKNFKVHKVHNEIDNSYIYVCTRK